MWVQFSGLLFRHHKRIGMHVWEMDRMSHAGIRYIPGPSCFWNFSTRRLVSSYWSGVKRGFCASRYLLHVSSSLGIGRRGRLSWKWYVGTLVLGTIYLSSSVLELTRQSKKEWYSNCHDNKYEYMKHISNWEWKILATAKLCTKSEDIFSI